MRLEHALALVLPAYFPLAAYADGAAFKASVGGVYSYSLGDGFIANEDPSDVFDHGGGFEVTAGVRFGFFSVAGSYIRTYHRVGDLSPYAHLPEVQAYHQRVSLGWQSQFCDWPRERVSMIVGNDVGYGSFHQAASDDAENEADVRFDGVFFGSSVGACFRPARVLGIELLGRVDIGSIVGATGEVTVGGVSTTTQPPSFESRALYEFSPVLRLVLFIDGASSEEDEDE